MPLKPKPSLVLTAGAVAMFFGVALTLRFVTSRAAPWEVAIALLVVVTSVAWIAHFLWFSQIAISGGHIYQDRWWGLGDRMVSVPEVGRVGLRLGQNFYGGTIRAIRIEWPGNVIQLTADYYRLADLRDLVDCLLAAGADVNADVRDFVGHTMATTRHAT